MLTTAMHEVADAFISSPCFDVNSNSVEDYVCQVGHTF